MYYASDYIDKYIGLALDSLKVGRWVLVGPAGIISSISDDRVHCFATKQEAIDDFGSRILDSRRVPKVRRIAPGHYSYITKNCDTGLDNEPVDIVKLTKDNLDQYKELLHSDFIELKRELLRIDADILRERENKDRIIKERVHAYIWPREYEVGDIVKLKEDIDIRGDYFEKGCVFEIVEITDNGFDLEHETGAKITSISPDKIE